MQNILNCPRCGKIFARGLREVCQDCHKKEEEDFQVVYKYVRKKENRMASISEVEEATGVDKKFIHKYIKQGRLHLASLPNLSYPCEACGAMIREGRICSNCNSNIKTDLERVDREKRFQDRKKRDDNSRNITYHTLKNKLD